MSRREEAVYIISVAAELAGVHPQTLRIYERKGLISPYRTPGGTRRYSEADLERLRVIQRLTAAGVNLEGVRRILELEDQNRRLRAQVDRLRRLLEDAERRMVSRPSRIIEAKRRITRHLPAIRRNPDGSIIDRKS